MYDEQDQPKHRALWNTTCQSNCIVDRMYHDECTGYGWSGMTGTTCCNAEAFCKLFSRNSWLIMSNAANRSNRPVLQNLPCWQLTGCLIKRVAWWPETGLQRRKQTSSTWVVLQLLSHQTLQQFGQDWSLK